MANETNPAWVARPQTSGPAAGFIPFAATMRLLSGRTWARTVAVILAGRPCPRG